jgi:hypothetical protein
MSDELTNEPAKTDSGGMTADLARELFDRMSADAPEDFSFIEQYYHPEVRFQDPIQKVVGRDAFIEMSERLVRRCKELRSKANDVAQSGDVIFVQWTMEMRFGSAPLSTIEGVTRLRLDERGRVIEHRDYFDLWGDSLESIPLIGSLYRRFVGLMG